MANMILQANGIDGKIELLNDRIVITRSGIFNMFKYGLNSKREIPLGAIAEVSFKPPSLFGMGQIEFLRSGVTNNSNDKKNPNQNVVKFNKKEAVVFEQLKEKIFEMINQQRKA